MPSQGARLLGLVCSLLGLLGCLGLAPAYAVSDQDVRERILAQLHNARLLESTHVHIVVQRGQVALSGTVLLYNQKMRYEHIVWQTSGVVEVDNTIRVVPRLPIEDTAITRHIQSIITGQARLHNAEITVDVTQGAVRLSGTFYEPDDLVSLQHQLGEIEGVIRLEIMVRFAT